MMSSVLDCAISFLVGLDPPQLAQWTSSTELAKQSSWIRITPRDTKLIKNLLRRQVVATRSTLSLLTTIYDHGESTTNGRVSRRTTTTRRS